MSADLRVTDIIVGERDRQELGDIAELARSIDRVGLLHPVVITEDGELVAGDRRLAAVQHLGWEFVPVTVVSLETAADVLQAEADENTCRKGLTPYEAARARERRAKLLAPRAKEAQRRAGTERGRGAKASANLAEATPKPAGREVRKAASTGTGYSGSTLDKVDKIRDAAERGVIKRGKAEIPAPAPVVEIARKALENVKQTGAAVDRSSRDLNAAVEAYVGADPDVQRARLSKQFSDAMGRALALIHFDPEAIAAVMESDDWDITEDQFNAIAKFWAQLKTHKAQGLRLVGGSNV